MNQESLIMAATELPLGFKIKFDPSEEEVMTYLAYKSNQQILPSEFIQEIDLYTIEDLDILFRNNEKSIYVFTKLKKVSMNGKRIDRRVDSGLKTWKGVDGAKRIYNSRGVYMGEKKNFVLINNTNKTKVGYNMVEFSLSQELLRNSKLKDYVICKIKKKIRVNNLLFYSNGENVQIPVPVVVPVLMQQQYDVSINNEGDVPIPMHEEKENSTSDNVMVSNVVGGNVFTPMHEEKGNPTFDNSWVSTVAGDNISTPMHEEKENPTFDNPTISNIFVNIDNNEDIHFTSIKDNIHVPIDPNTNIHVPIDSNTDKCKEKEILDMKAGYLEAEVEDVSYQYNNQYLDNNLNNLLDSSWENILNYNP